MVYVVTIVVDVIEKDLQFYQSCLSHYNKLYFVKPTLIITFFTYLENIMQKGFCF